MTTKKSIKLISLISGGIDSPVATYLMLMHGASVMGLYMDNQPFTDKKTKTKVINLVRRLEIEAKIKIKLFIVKHWNNQKLISRTCDRHVGCILCRRMMLRVGEQLANHEHAAGLVTGESLGQVASQTLQNIYVENRAVKIPILRPLIGLDKLEIQNIAQKIGTYEISILPGPCCTIVPSKPSTNAALGRILREEERLDIDGMVKESLDNIEVIY